MIIRWHTHELSNASLGSVSCLLTMQSGWDVLTKSQPPPQCWSILLFLSIAHLTTPIVRVNSGCLLGLDRNMGPDFSVWCTEQIGLWWFFFCLFWFSWGTRGRSGVYVYRSQYVGSAGIRVVMVSRTRHYLVIGYPKCVPEIMRFRYARRSFEESLRYDHPQFMSIRIETVPMMPP